RQEWDKRQQQTVADAQTEQASGWMQGDVKRGLKIARLKVEDVPGIPPEATWGTVEGWQRASAAIDNASDKLGVEETARPASDLLAPDIMTPQPAPSEDWDSIRNRVADGSASRSDQATYKRMRRERGL
ncbi:hypothetical protein LCGC14_3128040, partial [marine sediment metagenome]